MHLPLGCPRHSLAQDPGHRGLALHIEKPGGRKLLQRAHGGDIVVGEQLGLVVDVSEPHCTPQLLQPRDSSAGQLGHLDAVVAPRPTQ